MAQEALHNAAHHSKGKNAWVRLSYVQNGGAVQVKLSVRDDGQGFDQQGTFDPSAGHFGILGMQERAERIGGKFRLESHPEQAQRLRSQPGCTLQARFFTRSSHRTFREGNPKS